MSTPRPTGPTVSVRFRLGLSLAAVLAAAGCAQGQRASDPPAAPIGLFTTLPILWPETDDIRGLLQGGAAQHWALAALRREAELRPLNTLAGDAAPLAGIGLLVMAQPRVLAPQENVALDRWVRRGGRVLLFADPLLTGETRFALGDKRRPQDAVLLSPILTRWGLRLEFDELQPAGRHHAALLGGALPVNLPGRLALSGTGGSCRILAQGLAARCRIDRGAALIIADAALFEPAQGADAEARSTLLQAMVQTARDD